MRVDVYNEDNERLAQTVTLTLAVKRKIFTIAYLTFSELPWSLRIQKTANERLTNVRLYCRTQCLISQMLYCTRVFAEQNLVYDIVQNLLMNKLLCNKYWTVNPTQRAGHCLMELINEIKENIKQFCSLRKQYSTSCNICWPMLIRVHSLNYQKLCYYTETMFLATDGKDGKGLKVKLGQCIFQVIS